MQTDELVPGEHPRSDCVFRWVADEDTSSVESSARDGSSLALESSVSSCEICSRSRLI